MTKQDEDRSFFAVWLINEVARAWSMSAPLAYRLLQRGDIVNGYILPYYDQLHTMGSDALIDDITRLSQKRGLIA